MRRSIYTKPRYLFFGGREIGKKKEPQSGSFITT